MAAEIFGLRSAGVLLGILHFGMGIGEAIGPVVTGRIFDVTDGYNLAFIIGGIITIAGIILILIVRPAVGKGSRNSFSILEDTGRLQPQ